MGKGGQSSILRLATVVMLGVFLVVATLAAQFTIEWVLVTFNWFAGGSMLGAIDTPPMHILGWNVEGRVDKYLLTLGIVVVLALVARNLGRSEVGRSWMAVRDLDVAAEISVFTSKQILIQTGVAMLAQANQLPQNLLRLFQ